VTVRPRLDERGFTLAEMLVATTLALLVGVGAVSFVRAQSYAMRTQAGQADMNDSARGTVEFMAREIRLAGYWPRPPCPGAPGGPAAGFGIVSAGPQSLRIQYDLNENGAIDAGAAASEDITYQYDATNQKVQRVVGGVVSDLATDVPSAGFKFRYYNVLNVEQVGAGGGALSAAQAAAVTRISVLLEPTKAPDARTTSQVHASLWTNIGLRNREYPCQ